VRLLEGGPQRVEELELADVPPAFRSTSSRPSCGLQAMAFAVSAGRRLGSAAFNEGATTTLRRTTCARFLRRVANGAAWLPGPPGPAHGPGGRLAMLSYSTEASGSGNEVDKVHEATALVCDRSRTCPWTG
jgi:hypothetical protein